MHEFPPCGVRKSRYVPKHRANVETKVNATCLLDLEFVDWNANSEKMETRPSIFVPEMHHLAPCSKRVRGRVKGPNR